MEQEIGEEPLSIPTLGRPFHLGMLYDIRSDTIIQGITLWDQSTLNEVVVTERELSTSEVIFDTYKDKSSALNINGGLKLSCLAGLLDVSGAAKYLFNRKRSSHVERLTLAYKCIVKDEMIAKYHLGNRNIQYPEVLDHTNATHVVTGITYGGNAIFVFEKEKSSDSTGSEVSGILSAMVNKISKGDFGAELSYKKTEKIKADPTNITCTYFGDIKPNENPTSYEDAIGLYRQLAVDIRDKENAVPVSALLYPLSKLHRNSCKIVRNVSECLVDRIEKCMENFDHFHMKCNDLLKSDASKKFPIIRDEINAFIQLLTFYEFAFQEDIRKILPSIRGGEIEEDVLTGILTSKESSPFGNDSLKCWIETRASHIEILQRCIPFITDIKFVSKTADLSAVVMNPEYSHVFCFTILVPSCKIHLEKMSNHLINLNIHISEDSNGEITELQRSTTAIETTIVEKVRHFKGFFERNKTNKVVCFIVAAEMVCSNDFQAEIRFYEYGRLNQKDFEIPSA